MSTPAVQVLGVHPLRVSDQLLEEQLSIFYPDGCTPEDRDATREQLESVVLVEVRVMSRDGRFTIDDFTQPLAEVSRDNWQAPWAEAYLTIDGESLIADRGGRTPESGDLRIAFFLHFWNPESPLRCSYGDIPCPAAAPMPERLERLVPYEPLD